MKNGQFGSHFLHVIQKMTPPASQSIGFSIPILNEAPVNKWCNFKAEYPAVSFSRPWTIPNDAKNNKKQNWINLGDSLDGTEDRIKLDIFPFWAPGANFEVLPRAKKSKLGQTKKYTPRTIPNDARNIIELG